MNYLSDYVIVSAMLFGIGVYGLVTKRNALRLLFAVELMINAANLNFVAFGQYLPFQGGVQPLAPNALGQTFVLFSIALAAAEAAVILAIVVVAYRLHEDVDVSELKTMEG
ncbi:MAG: NADH-quinone oxidoreductase subunit NuoK [Nitrososphaerota archaeon]|nr:NADH-quinone oxidoreductase subunit NuoK [Nitrososphaerota archaeon]